MRLVSTGVRAQRAVEPSEPEEATEPVHHEHAHSEHHEDSHPEHHEDSHSEHHEDSHSEHHERSHPEHHPGHDYNHMKEKFMNEFTHLPSKPLLGNKPNLLKLSVYLWVFFFGTPIQMSIYF